MNNKVWSNNLIKLVDSEYKHRWELYCDNVLQKLSEVTVWVDCGCGNDLMTEENENAAKLAIGIDKIIPQIRKKNFINGDLKFLPLRSASVDLLTFRFVVEHFESVDPYISEMERVLKNEGFIIILTTNFLSPIIQIPRLVPKNIKNRIIKFLYKVSEKDIFPAYHKLNTKSAFEKVKNKFHLKSFIYISDLNSTRKWLFLIFLIFHAITKIKFLNRFRSNILIVLQKK